MKITPTPIDGVFAIETEPHSDARGDFARSYCAHEFRAAGIRFDIVQANISRNKKRATLRGMHFQDQPTPDPKLVRCTRGRIYDVAVDLRPGSDSFCRWTAAELTPERQNGLFVPAGCAHGTNCRMKPVCPAARRSSRSPPAC